MTDKDVVKVTAAACSEGTRRCSSTYSRIVVLTLSVFAGISIAMMLPSKYRQSLAQKHDPVSSRPIVGAIRWDAWTGGEVTRQMERTLGPDKYHSRLPWFSKVTGRNTVRIQGNTQDILDREIDFAADAGLDYWAFLMYPASDHMSGPLDSYLASPKRLRVKFCVILHNNLGVSEKEWPKERGRIVALLKQPGYQTVLGGRPLVYFFSASIARFTDLRRAVEKAGINAYYVEMGWDPSRNVAAASRRGFHASSAYAYGSDHRTFAELASAVEKNYWSSAARASSSGGKYVPLVTTGWDKQPRKDNPVSWEKDDAYHRQMTFPSRATPGEIAAHLERAIRFVRDHPDLCEANAVIVYAWNEYDEGGWLAPTWTRSGKPDTSRLDAVRKVLKPASPPYRR